MEIALRRGRLDAHLAATLVVQAAVLTAVAAAAVTLLDGAPRIAALTVLGVLGLPYLGSYVSGWARMRRVEHPLALHAFGVFARSLLGDVTAPWSAVASARIERTWTGRLLRIRLVPPTDPRHDEVVVTSAAPAALLRRVDRHGLRLSLRVLDVETDLLEDGFATQSRGRVRLT